MASVFKSESFSKLSPADQSRNINLINLGRFLENYFEFGLKNEKVLNVCVVWKCVRDWILKATVLYKNVQSVIIDLGHEYGQVPDLTATRWFMCRIERYQGRKTKAYPSSWTRSVRPETMNQWVKVEFIFHRSLFRTTGYSLFRSVIF